MTLVDETCHQPLVIRFAAAPQCKITLSAFFERILCELVSPVLVLGLVAGRVRKIAYLAEDESRLLRLRIASREAVSPFFPLPISRSVPARMRTMW